MSSVLPTLVTIAATNNVEWELDANMARTGRWRKRQYWGEVNDKRTFSERKPVAWREGPMR